MRNARVRCCRVVLCVAAVAGAVALPAVAAAPWQGMQVESSVPIDLSKPEVKVPLDIEPSAFAFDPVLVTVEPSGDAKKVVKIKLRFRNNSDRDYFVYASAYLVDAEAKPIVSKNKKDKADDDDDTHLTFSFKLPNADAERVQKCVLRFAFEKD